MTAPVAGPGAAVAERGGESLTAERDELKYLVRPERAEPLRAAVAAELAPHRHEGPGANTLPHARHYATTVYFDTPSGHLYRAARSEPSHAKLRAREYYDVHPELTELATDPSQLVRYDSTLWLELKLRDGDRTRKRRIGVPKAEVADYFASGTVSPQMLAIQRAAHREEAEAVLADLAAFRERYDEPLGAVALVNYRRQAFQDAAGNLRVTLDRELSVFTPAADLWQRKHALVRSSLGDEVARQPLLVVEVKSRSAVPGWLQAALGAAGATDDRFSKFLYACEALARAR